MPFQKRYEGSYSQNQSKDILGRSNTIDVSLIQSTTPTAATNINELIIEFTAGENLTAMNAGSVVSGLLYNAKNKYSDSKPAMGIILDTVATGEQARLQIAGYCNMNFGLTANKDLFLRYGSNNISITPLTAVSANEDGVQCLGRLLGVNTLLIDIGEFNQIT
jgi:hypothetical protein